MKNKRASRRGSRMVFAAYRLLHGALARLPVGFAFRLGGVLGLAAWAILPRYRKLAAHNIRIAQAGGVQSDENVSRIVRRHFRGLGANLLSSPALASLPVERLREHIDLGDMRKLLEASAQGRGVIALLSHVGNWEMLAQLSVFEPSLRSAAIYQALGDLRIDAHVRATRKARGLHLFSRMDGFDAPIRHVRDGGLLGVLADQHAGDKGVWTPLFGRIASTSPLTAMIALRTGAPIVPATVYTTGCARWKLVVDEPIEPKPNDSVESLTASVNRAIERQILRQPNDWFWVHNRWKTPRPAFLLRRYRRGVHLPDNMPASSLQPFRILVRSSNWLGDAVMSVPAVQAVKAGRPDAHVTILCREKLADLWRAVPGADEVIGIAEGDGVLATVRRLRRLPCFDVGIVLPNSLRTGLEMLLAGVPRRVGHAGHHRAWTLNQIIPEKVGRLRAEHHVHHYLRMAAHVGAKPDASRFDIPARSPDSDPSAADTVRIGLCPGAEYGGAKRWPLERFAAAAAEVSKRRSCQWVVFGTAREAAMGDTLCEQIGGHAENLAGRTTLAGLIAELRRCRALLTNDTGTMHLAALLGLPVAAIFGSTEPRLTGPLGDAHIILRHQVECSPCFLRECPLDFRCMNAVEVDEAVEAVLRLISEPQPRPASHP